MILPEPLFFYVQDERYTAGAGRAGAVPLRLALCMWMNGTPRAQDAHDCRDAGGRATQEQLPRSGASQVSTMYVDERYTAGASSR
jgi:hypothetical protein